MVEWDGRGLPPAAARRMARFGATGTRTSLLPVPGAVGVEAVGLSPVGEVMGCIVEHLGWAGYGGCGYYGRGYGFGGVPGYAARTITSGSGRAYAGFAPYADALDRGYRTALRRMTEEATAMGADGVVGVRLTVEHLGEGNREFVAMGTAVRASSRSRPRQPFTTDLAGQDVAKLLPRGWVPVALVVALSVAIRHDDYATWQQSSSWTMNTEVSGYTELVNDTRADARRHFERRVAAVGGDGAVVSAMQLHTWEIEPGEGHRDHVAEATIFGTAVAGFSTGRPASSAALSILPLRRTGGQGAE